MSKPVATISHMHVYPMFDGKSPHVGGPVIGPGAANVLVNWQPVAKMGDMCTCSGPPDITIEGVPTVLVNGKPVATLGSKTAHGGVITQGSPNVIVGSSGASTPTNIAPMAKIPFPKFEFESYVRSVFSNKNKEAEAEQQLERECISGW